MSSKPARRRSDHTQKQVQRIRRSFLDPAFVGTLDFDLALELFHHRVVRKARVVYFYTPEWPYLDRTKLKSVRGRACSQVSFSLRMEPEDDGEVARWEGVDDLAADGMLPRKVWDDIYDAIDARCKKEDQNRRKWAKSRRRGVESRKRKTRTPR